MLPLPLMGGARVERAQQRRTQALVGPSAAWDVSCVVGLPGAGEGLCRRPAAPCRPTPIRRPAAPPLEKKKPSGKNTPKQQQDTIHDLSQYRLSERELILKLRVRRRHRPPSSDHNSSFGIGGVGAATATGALIRRLVAATSHPNNQDPSSLPFTNIALRERRQLQQLQHQHHHQSSVPPRPRGRRRDQLPPPPWASSAVASTASSTTSASACPSGFVVLRAVRRPRGPSSLCGAFSSPRSSTDTPGPLPSAPPLLSPPPPPPPPPPPASPPPAPSAELERVLGAIETEVQSGEASAEGAVSADRVCSLEARITLLQAELAWRGAAAASGGQRRRSGRTARTAVEAPASVTADAAISSSSSSSSSSAEQGNDLDDDEDEDDDDDDFWATFDGVCGGGGGGGGGNDDDSGSDGSSEGDAGTAAARAVAQRWRWETPSPEREEEEEVKVEEKEAEEHKDERTAAASAGADDSGSSSSDSVDADEQKDEEQDEDSLPLPRYGDRARRR
jgi:hypothetical protein